MIPMPLFYLSHAELADIIRQQLFILKNKGAFAYYVEIHKSRTDILFGTGDAGCLRLLGFSGWDIHIHEDCSGNRCSAVGSSDLGSLHGSQSSETSTRCLLSCSENRIVWAGNSSFVLCWEDKPWHRVCYSICDQYDPFICMEIENVWSDYT